MMRDIDHPAMVKHGIPWGSTTGITSAELAARGFTGIPSLLGMEKYHDWTMDIGKNYLMVDGIGWKMKGYTCCGWTHAGVEEILETGRHLDELSRIKELTVRLRA